MVKCELPGWASVWQRVRISALFAEQIAELPAISNREPF